MITIKTATISEVVALSQQIPEFHQPYTAQEYEKRLTNTPHLILIAYQNNQPIGFKVGYDKGTSFYSWMGGVLPAFRKKGIAKLLAQTQENWAKKQGYKTITLKTRNQHRAMLIFALKNGFNIVGFEPKSSVEAHRIVLQKHLTANS